MRFLINVKTLSTSNSPLEEVVAKKIKQPWDPDAQLNISPLSTPASGFSSKRKKCIVDDPMDFVDAHMLSAWNLNDLTSAGKLLRKPPLACHFDDEHEMRRVYSMIYDVYRCKHLKSSSIAWRSRCVLFATLSGTRFHLLLIELCMLFQWVSKSQIGHSENNGFCFCHFFLLLLIFFFSGIKLLSDFKSRFFFCFF